MNKQFPQGEIELVKKGLRKCSPLVVIKEMQIKAILKCYFTPTKLAFLKNGWAGKLLVIWVFLSGGATNWYQL